jgi:hypothetical protein
VFRVGLIPLSRIDCLSQRVYLHNALGRQGLIAVDLVI